MNAQEADVYFELEYILNKDKLPSESKRLLILKLLRDLIYQEIEDGKIKNLKDFSNKFSEDLEDEVKTQAYNKSLFPSHVMEKVFGL